MIHGRKKDKLQRNDFTELGIRLKVVDHEEYHYVTRSLASGQLKNIRIEYFEQVQYMKSAIMVGNQSHACVDV